jgi:hypothetical protein
MVETSWIQPCLEPERTAEGWADGARADAIPNAAGGEGGHGPLNRKA